MTVTSCFETIVSQYGTLVWYLNLGSLAGLGPESGLQHCAVPANDTTCPCDHTWGVAAIAIDVGFLGCCS